MSSLKVFSWNVNGIRAAQKKGFAQWLTQSAADVVLLQEVRASEADIPTEILQSGYAHTWLEAVKKGYSGVGILHKFKHEEVQVMKGIGNEEFDSEGRVITLVWGNLAFVSAYFPNSQEGGKRLGYKLAFCEAFAEHLRLLEQKKLKVIAGGDFNIAHEPIDLANPKSNEKNAGYLPEERNWFSGLLQTGFTDTFRVFQREGGHYSWWSNRPGVRERNVGWRIDYHVVSNSLQPQLIGAAIHNDVLGSDHCPVSIEIQC